MKMPLDESMYEVIKSVNTLKTITNMPYNDRNLNQTKIHNKKFRSYCYIYYRKKKYKYNVCMHKLFR